MRVNRGRILVIRGGAIGDFILTLPALAALRAQFPETHVEVLGYPHIAELARTAGLVDRVQPIEARSLAGFFAAGGALDPATAGYFSRFDIIVSYLFDPDQIFQTNVKQCSRAQFIVGPHRPNEREATHATQVYLKPLERLAIFDADPVPQIRLPPDPAALTTIALHPGSGSEKKNWPESNWAELIERLVDDSDARILLVGGEAEHERLARLMAKLPSGRGELLRSLPLPELAAHIARCRVFLGHDSGISHLAAAVGLRTLVLWGDTSEAIWRPQGNHVEVLRSSEGLARLCVGAVHERLLAVLAS
jgi:heptosyltransferase-2